MGPMNSFLTVMTLLHLMCGYKHKEMWTTNKDDLFSNKHPIFVGGNTDMLEGITIFESMIFDSKNDGTLPATKKI